MSRRPQALFRGSELPRLLILAAIVMAGWPMVLLFAGPHQAADEPPPPPSVPVEKITKIVPDLGVEFQALRDKRPIETRDSAAYAILLQRTRETSPEELAKQARRDVFWTQLWERPEGYRGVPIHLEGTAKKVLTHEVGEAMSPKGRLFEAWFYSDENRAFPYVVTFEDAPPGLQIGHELNQRVTIDAYFLKLLKYHAGDTYRAAPMLVGRVRWMPASVEGPPPMVEARDWAKKNAVFLLIASLLGYVALRAFFQIRKALTRPSQSAAFRTSSEGLPPEEVADWLRTLPERSTEAEEDVPPLDDGPHLRDR